MPTTVQLNTRINPELKRQGDAVFVRAGLTSSEVVRALWTYAATTQTVPDILLSHRPQEREERVRRIREGAGLVRNELGALGIQLANTPFDYASLHDAMYDDLTGEIYGHFASS